MTRTKTGANGTFARIGASFVLAAAAVGTLAVPSQAAASIPVITPSSTTGPSGGTNVIVLNLASTAATKFTSGSVGIQFQNTTAKDQAKATCATNPMTNGASTAVVAAAAKLRYLSTTKVSIEVPDLSSGTTGYWIVCAYNAAPSAGVIGSTATVVGRGAYTVASAPTVTAVNGNDGTTVGQTVVSGPSLGGQTLTLTGTNFPTSITAATPFSVTVGGVAATVTPVSATSATVSTPAKAASTGNKVAVTTLGGSANWPGTYTYANGIIVSPNTVVGGSSVDVDIQGVGFSSLTFNATATAGLTQTAAGDSTGTNHSGAHVYLIRATTAGVGYDPTVYDATHDKTNGQVAECVAPVVISDTELICTINSAKSITIASHVYTYASTQLADGAYTVVVVNTGDAVVPTYKTVVSSGATFTVGNF